MSSKILTPLQKSLLDRGLKFIPSPHIDNIDNIKSANERFQRNLKCTYFFRNHPPRGPRTLFIEKSKWKPPNGAIAPEILATFSELDSELNNISITREKSNLTREERGALNLLKKDKNIIIKKSDKGSCCVILNRDDYILEAESQLNNKKHYAILDNPIYKETAIMINAVLDTLVKNKFIKEKQYKYLSAKPDCRQRHLYTLPKIHKDPKTEWFVPNKIPKGRPIISDCSSESYAVSEYIDHFLLPLACQHPAYLKDTNDFVTKIKNLTVPENALLISMDVSSMYTNIDNVTGLSAVRKAFHRNPDPDRPDEQILELLEICLSRNDFDFNGKTYLQTSGTAMGKRFAPSYANLFMAEWEREVLPLCPLNPLFYGRFLDDIFMVWTYSLEEFWEFFEILNNHHPSVKLTANVSQKSIDFLDTTVYKDDSISETNKLDIKVFFKETDTHQLLLKSSFHPKHTFSGIIKSQILRFHRICTKKKDFEQACTIVFSKLRDRGYSKRFLRTIKNSTLAQVEARRLLEIQGPPGPRSIPCMSTRCKTCPFVPTTHWITNTTTNKRYPINEHLDCASKNLVYLISCKKCPKQYVGETKNSLRQRFSAHKSDIKLNKDKPVAFHFNLEDHSIQDLTITPIESINITATEEETTKFRLERESHWIETLNTARPSGLNVHSGHGIAPFVVKFNGTANKASKIVRKYYHKLQDDFPHVFKQNMIVAYSKNKNLNDILVSSKLKPIEPTPL